MSRVQHINLSHFKKFLFYIGCILVTEFFMLQIYWTQDKVFSYKKINVSLKNIIIDLARVCIRE